VGWAAGRAGGTAGAAGFFSASEGDFWEGVFSLVSSAIYFVVEVIDSGF
jgi:nicotinamide riboside transporter PnuC